MYSDIAFVGADQRSDFNQIEIKLEDIFKIYRKEVKSSTYF